MIIQFPVFILPYTQQPLILYQIETVTSSHFRPNKQANSYTHLQIDRPFIALNSETYILIRQQELRICKNIGYKFQCEELAMVNTNPNTASNVQCISIKAQISLKKSVNLPITLTKQI